MTSRSGTLRPRASGRGLWSRLRPKASTRALWQEQKAAGQSWRQKLHAWAYAGFPYGYIGSAIGERRRLRWLRLFFAPFLLKALKPLPWAESYHGKVMPTAQAARLVQVHESLDAMVPEQVIPFESAQHLVLQRDQPIVALDCPCRVARENPCLPLDVCLIVGDPFASFILEHQPKRSRAISPDEAVAILEAEARRGHVHHAFFKEAMINRFYAICNCCSCCCGAMSAHQHGTPMLISSGYVARVATEQCHACGLCTQVCPFGAIELRGYAWVESEACMGCGVCQQHCPHGAITLQRDPRKPAPLELPACAENVALQV
jgi:ferredoxin